MDKNEELQKWLNDDRYVQVEDIMALHGLSRDCAWSRLSRGKIKPEKKIFFGPKGTYFFYNKKQCDILMTAAAIKRADAQKMKANSKYVRAQQLETLWGVSRHSVVRYLKCYNIQPKKEMNLGAQLGTYVFYDRAECERARPFINQPEKEVEKVENIGELATATRYQILCETGADNFVWDKVTMKHKITPVKNYCDERGNFVSLFKKDETVSAILAYKNEQKQLLEKCIADKNLVTTTQLIELWMLKKSAVYAKIYRLKIKPHVKVKLENGNMWHFYKKSDCLEFCKQTDNSIANNECLPPIENNNYNPDIHVTMKDLMQFTGRSRYMIMQRFINKGIAPVGTPLIGKTVSYVYDLQKALDAVSDVLKPRYRKLLVKKQKEINPMEEKQMESPESKEQSPDIIPADTIDLFTMSELESELKQRGVELTAEVKAKINDSDMPEMQEIATMIRGNAKTIAIRLSVLNEIAGRLKKAEAHNDLKIKIEKVLRYASSKASVTRHDEYELNSLGYLTRNQALRMLSPFITQERAHQIFASHILKAYLYGKNRYVVLWDKDVVEKFIDDKESSLSIAETFTPVSDCISEKTDKVTPTSSSENKLDIILSRLNEIEHQIVYHENFGPSEDIINHFKSAIQSRSNVLAALMSRAKIVIHNESCVILLDQKFAVGKVGESGGKEIINDALIDIGCKDFNIYVLFSGKHDVKNNQEK